MLKADSLRETLTRANKWCRANPEAFTVFVEEGNIETTGETPSFMYRYTLVLFVMNFAGDIDDFTLPLMAWLWHNQPDLLLNPEKNRNVKFTTLINNDDNPTKKAGEKGFYLFPVPPDQKPGSNKRGN